MWEGGTLELCLEVVMLDIMTIAVIVFNLAEFRFFIVKMSSKEILAVAYDILVIWVISRFLYTVKELNMFIIQSLVEGHEGLIPNKWLWNLMEEFSFVGKVSVGNVLHQPVFNELAEVTVKGKFCSLEFLKESVMFLDMVLCPLLKSFNLKELSLFINKVILHQVVQEVILLLVSWMLNRVSDCLEKVNMFIIKILVVNLEPLLPNMWRWDFMKVSVQFKLVLEVTEILGTFRIMANSSDRVKQNLMFFIDSS